MRSLLVMGIPYQHAPEVSIVRTDTCLKLPSAPPQIHPLDSVRTPNSFLVTSPTRQGWQPVAGGRFRAAGETTTGHASQSGLHLGGMPDPRGRRLGPAFVQG